MAWLLLLIVPIFSTITEACGIDYSDIEAMGASCSPRDTCSSNTARTFFTSNCECDSWCYSFGDCCVDAYSSGRQSRVSSNKGISCFQFDDNQGVYAIGKCKSSWNGSSVVQRKCENEETDFSDPLLYLPSTDTHTNTTYRNRYCAECNYGSLDILSNWEVRLNCSSLEYADSIYHNITEDFIVRNITRVGGSWGVYHWNNTLNDISFYPCEVSYGLPYNLRPHVRFCRPHLISTCVADWSRNSIRRKCLKYMAVIYIDSQAYRNVHCALCNRVSIRNYTCVASGITSRTPSMSFTVLLDVNPSDGDRVGESNLCSEEQTWDPFANRCRALTCALDGHVYRNGRCVPQ